MADGTEYDVSNAYDGMDAHTLRRLLDVPRLALLGSVSSTMDVAHNLAADGAPGGTLVLADQQHAGRGRGGHRWSSEPGCGLWFTLVERPIDSVALKVLSLRVGLRLAAVLDRYTLTKVQLKWPNDLYVGSGKLAGILTEVRWQDGRPLWVAVGVGINVRRPTGVSGAAALGDVRRPDLLAEVIPAVRGAASGRGALSSAELVAYASRDMARGRATIAPVVGRVAGIDSEGHLLIEAASGLERFDGGSLVLEDAIA